MGFVVPDGQRGIPHPEEFALRLFQLPELAHIKDSEARIEWLFRTHAEVKGGRQVLGTVFRPEVNGRLRELFTWLLEDKFGGTDEDAPIAFLIVLDYEFWAEAPDLQREILVYHELTHIQPALDKYGAPRFDKETGLPVLTLAGHDIEEFTAVVRRYGSYHQGLVDFIDAAREADAGGAVRQAMGRAEPAHDDGTHKPPW